MKEGQHQNCPLASRSPDAHCTNVRMCTVFTNMTCTEEMFRNQQLCHYHDWVLFVSCRNSKDTVVLMKPSLGEFSSLFL